MDNLKGGRFGGTKEEKEWKKNYGIMEEIDVKFLDFLLIGFLILDILLIWFFDFGCFECEGFHCGSF